MGAPSEDRREEDCGSTTTATTTDRPEERPKRKRRRPKRSIWVKWEQFGGMWIPVPRLRWVLAVFAVFWVCGTHNRTVESQRALAKMEVSMREVEERVDTLNSVSNELQAFTLEALSERREAREAAPDPKSWQEPAADPTCRPGAGVCEGETDRAAQASQQNPDQRRGFDVQEYCLLHPYDADVCTGFYSGYLTPEYSLDLNGRLFATSEEEPRLSRSVWVRSFGESRANEHHANKLVDVCIPKKKDGGLGGMFSFGLFIAPSKALRDQRSCRTLPSIKGCSSAFPTGIAFRHEPKRNEAPEVDLNFDQYNYFCAAESWDEDSGPSTLLEFAREAPEGAYIAHGDFYMRIRRDRDGSVYKPGKQSFDPSYDKDYCAEWLLESIVADE